MADRPSREHGDPETVAAGSTDRLVYVMPEQMMQGSSSDEIDLRKLWNILWTGKWWIIPVTVLFAIASVLYALVATEWYRAEVLLAPAEEQNTPAIGGQLGGLAALAGVTVDGGNSVEAVATLKSREFAREFIEDYGLLTVFFADEWDDAQKRWLMQDLRKQPDLRDAVRYFHDNVLRVNENKQTSLVTLAVEWTDPVVAAEWAAALVKRLNDRLRQQALHDAEVNVEFLQTELAQTSIVTLQQAIGRLLEGELQKLMLARGNEEFGFRVIDGADAPKDPIRPRRVIIVVLGTLLGGIVGFAAVVLHRLVGNRRLDFSVTPAV